ncbi:hypothetical protein D9M70_640460 [compost metagenome]
MFAEILENVGNLLSQLMGGHHYEASQGLKLFFGGQQMQDRNSKSSGFPGARLGNAQDILTGQHPGENFVLDIGGFPEALFGYSPFDLG